MTLHIKFKNGQDSPHWETLDISNGKPLAQIPLSKIKTATGTNNIDPFAITEAFETTFKNTNINTLEEDAIKGLCDEALFKLALNHPH